MKVDYINISKDNYNVFHGLLVSYYKDGEDKDTPQDIIDDFIKQLFDMIVKNKIQGRLISSDKKIIGFIIWMIDEEGSPYSMIPGYGTILEIGLIKDYRNKGIGKNIVEYAENQMLEKGVNDFYITVYELAKIFWENCGYINTGEVAFNGLYIYKKLKEIMN